MSDDKSRRRFIKKISAGAAALAGSALTGSASGKSNNKKEENVMKDTSHIKIRPLGFQWETADPFLFCVHHEDFYPKGNGQAGPDASLEGRNLGQDFTVKDGWRMYHGKRVPGFPVHPHRGFETVTIVRKGLIDHSDSMGAAGRYGGGDVQWMTAGKGMQHAEMFPLLKKDGENHLELFQIWLNLPKLKKFAEPSFKMLWGEKIPKKIVKDGTGKSVEIAVIAGAYEGAKPPSPPPDSWASDPKNDVAILTVKMESGASWTLPKAEEGVNRTLYFFKGDSLSVDGKEVKSYHAIDIDIYAGVSVKNGNEESELLLLQGRPIGEPVEQYGPFVMNTKAEIQQAFEDYRETNFGGWPWEAPDPVHPHDKGRFAKHADGREETPG